MKKLEQNRVCLLVDVDSFSVQVLQKAFGLDIVGKPCVVATAGDDPTVKLSTLNYEAKAAGILRSDTIEEAVLKCPDVNVIRFPASAKDPKKSDMSVQEQATKDLVAAGVEYCNRFEKSIRPILHMESIDEFYLDVTALVESLAKNPDAETDSRSCLDEIDGLKYKFIVEGAGGSTEAKDWKPKDTAEEKLHCGLHLASQVVKAIRDKTGLNASVGIGTNKLIAKLACGLNKPLAVTLVLAEGFSQMSTRIPIPSVPGLGGAVGKAVLKNLKVTCPEGGEGDGESASVVASMGDLISFTMDQLADVRMKEDGDRRIGTRRGQQIYDTVRGIDDSPVTLKLKHP